MNEVVLKRDCSIILLSEKQSQLLNKLSLVQFEDLFQVSLLNFESLRRE